MALFKILKGSSENLEKKKATEGYAYFTPDDGKFYIDIGTTSTAEDVVIGNNNVEKIENKTPNRICINQKIFSYNDFDLLDCGTSTEAEEELLIFTCI